MRSLLVIWFGQTVSMLGTTMTSFALSLWIFEQTGSATSLVLTMLVNNLPLVFVSLYAGVIVDRFNRRAIMIGSDIAAALLSLVLLGLFSSGLQVWHIYAIILLSAPFKYIQNLAYEASLTMMVDLKDYVRAGSLGSLTRYSVAILGPAMAAPLYLVIGLNGIIVIDLLSFLIAVVPLLLIPIANPTRVTSRRTGLQQIRDGFALIRHHPMLVWLLAFHATFEFFQVMGQSVKAPMILARTDSDPNVLAAVSVASGVGGVLAALLVGAWGGGRVRRLTIYFYGSIGGAIGKMLHGLSQVPAAWVGTQLFTSTNFPAQEGAYRALWMQEVEAGAQGRLFALNNFVIQVFTIPALLIAGPLADRVFAPAMNEGGALVGTFGWLVGTGTGAGFSLMFTLCGGLMLATALAAMWRLWRFNVRQTASA